MNTQSLSSPLRPSQAGNLCPRCGRLGKPVKPVTLESLLKPEALVRFGQANCRFCPDEQCEVVYFAESGGEVFVESELKVRVGIKDTIAPRHVCYCFDHTVEEIDEEVRLTGKSTVLDDIKTRMKVACWCETKNPQGSCCLSTVTRYVKAALDRNANPPAVLAGTNVEEDCCVSHSQAAVSASGDFKPSAKGWRRNAQRFSMFGSVISAVLASACCWLPLLLLAAGISGAAVGAVFERYRPIFLGVTFALLGLAFYFAYRPRAKVAARIGTDDDSRCATEGGCCGPAVPGTWTLQRFNRSMLWVVTVLVLAFAFFPNYGGLFSANRAPGISLGARDDRDTLAFAIEGMTCKACATVLQKELATVPGVASAEVSYEKQQAIVRLRKGSSTLVATLLSTVKDAGYGGTIINCAGVINQNH